MKKIKTTERNIVIFLMILMTFFTKANLSAADNTENSKKIKVGVLNNTTFAYQDENGTWRGMDVECMIRIAQYSGLDIEFVDSSNDPDFLGSLDRGIYDIVADVVKNPEREEKYLFTEEALENTINTMAVRMDDDRWDYGNIDQVSQMKIGVLASYANNRDFRAWCDRHEVKPEIIEYENIDLMTAALENSEIDGEVYSAVHGEQYSRQFRPIMKFLPEAGYFAFRKNDIDLKNKVDSALAQILSENVDFLSNIKSRYENQFNSNVFPFSAAEKAFITSHPVLKVAVVLSDSPYYKKNNNGTDGGIIPDYFDLIAKEKNIKFQYVPYETFDAAEEAVKSGEADLTGRYGGGVISAFQSGLVLTGNYATIDNILLTKPGKDVAEIKTISVIRKSMDEFRRMIGNVFPGAVLKEYSNAEECFQAMKDGNADAALMGFHSATWLINQTNSTTYSIIPVSGFSSDISAAVSENNPVLCSILNKGIAETKNSFAGIASKDTLPENDWKTMVSRIPPFVTSLTAVIMLALIAGLTWALIMLRHRQAERSAVLAQQAEMNLQKVQMEAIQKNIEMRNRFFANISHDMRTPLNAITGFIRMAEKGDISSDQRNMYLKKADNSSRLLVDLINDTLTISKATSGKLVLHPEPVQESLLLESITSPIRESAEEKGITFNVEKLFEQNRVISVDKLSFQKIMLNLLTNAVKYTPKGGHVWFTIRTDHQDGKIPESVFVIKDDGIGISPEYMKHLYEPFTQEKRTGYESSGTGLGLSIVKHLVDLMGGTIDVQSEMDQGTVFTVKLPLAEAEKAAVPQPMTEPSAQTDLSGKKVLLCEDNALNREIAMALLQDLKMTVESAENGAIGLEKFKNSPVGEFSAVLMDIRMPVMDGINTTEAIRGLDRPDAKTIPIIAMTADAFEDDVERCMEAGMTGHIAKPIEPGNLRGTLFAQIR